MAGVTDRPFRAICRSYGASLAVSEMVSSNPTLQDDRKTRLRCDHRGEPEPRAIQILGADPLHMAQAARLNVDRGAQIIDINMGCPAKKVCNVAAGSALLRDETQVARILESVVKAVEVPVTLKIRTGWDLHNRNAVRIARLAEDSGIRALAVHGRTRACGFSGVAEYSTIAEVKSAVGIPVIANGDIDSPDKARFVLDTTGADALMVGRAALGRPWQFRTINAFLTEGLRLQDPEPTERYRVLIQHVQELHAFYGPMAGVRIARKHIGWYAKHWPGFALDRLKPLFSEEKPDRQIQLTRELFETAFRKLAA